MIALDRQVLYPGAKISAEELTGIDFPIGYNSVSTVH